MTRVPGHLLHHLIRDSAQREPDAPALQHRSQTLSYAELWEQVSSCAQGLIGCGLAASDRVAVYLPKQLEAAIGLFGAAAAGGVFVPVNPGLKPVQVRHILTDCNVRILISSPERVALLADVLSDCPELIRIILVGGGSDKVPQPTRDLCSSWQELMHGQLGPGQPHRRIDNDMAAILYTSGSTGQPKGVVLSHRNMTVGARSVAEYLNNTPHERILAVLPFSFDYGFSQMSTAFSVGACSVLMEYLLPRDVIKAVARHRITGLAAVPPLWNQLAQLEWPDEARQSLSYITNSGGAMPRATTSALHNSLPNTRIYLMYGLTEAFRSTYLPPELVAERPDSMGKAIPNAEIVVVRKDGSECDPDEPGELVHRGALVALGYWNAPDKTAERFKPAPGRPPELGNPEIAVWSGDRVRRDAEGYLYFVGRSDEMIKTSGYRVSPTEIEEVVYAMGGLAQAVAFGVAHPMLGQAIVLVAQPAQTTGIDTDFILGHCRKELPNFMVPARIELHGELPKNPNGKIDRTALRNQYKDVFSGQADA